MRTPLEIGVLLRLILSAGWLSRVTRAQLNANSDNTIDVSTAVSATAAEEADDSATLFIMIVVSVVCGLAIIGAIAAAIALKVNGADATVCPESHDEREDETMQRQQASGEEEEPPSLTTPGEELGSAKKYSHTTTTNWPTDGGDDAPTSQGEMQETEEETSRHHISAAKEEPIGLEVDDDDDDDSSGEYELEEPQEQECHPSGGGEGFALPNPDTVGVTTTFAAPTSEPVVWSEALGGLDSSEEQS